MFVFDDDVMDEETEKINNDVIENDFDQEFDSEKQHDCEGCNCNDEIEQKIQNLENEIESLQDSNLRLRAEFDNFKKRTAKEKQGLYTSAQIDCIEKFLPVLDGFERGLKEFEKGADAGAENGSADAVVGFKMLCDSFGEVLKTIGVKSVGQKGEPFDPKFHNAVKTIEVDGADSNIVWEVLLKGYCMGDSVVRHAVVVVANP